MIFRRFTVGLAGDEAVLKTVTTVNKWRKKSHPFIVSVVVSMQSECWHGPIRELPCVGLRVIRSLSRLKLSKGILQWERRSRRWYPSKGPEKLYFLHRGVLSRNVSEFCPACWGKKGKRICGGYPRPIWLSLPVSADLPPPLLLMLSAFSWVSIVGPVHLSLQYLVYG